MNRKNRKNKARELKRDLRLKRIPSARQESLNIIYETLRKEYEYEEWGRQV